MLLAEGHPAEALTQYKVALKLSPNRFDGLANAARAAEACGRMDDARFYYRELLQVTNNGLASERPEIVQAHTFLKGAKEPVQAY
jgi:tetratricopeptide (TPR) repeat protein